MNRTTVACILVAFCLPAACGGGNQAANPPAPPAPTDTGAMPSATAAPSAAPTGTGAASAAPATSTAAPAASAAPAGPPGPGDWDKWSHDQKLAYMKSAVLPAEKTLFSGFDAKYGSMNCKTCHGSGAADGSFKMPNPDLPKLDATPAGFKKLQTGKAKIFDFMMKQVEPQTAQLLGEQPFDPKTNTGFGCFNCHTKK